MRNLLTACALLLAPGLGLAADAKTEPKAQEMLQMHRRMAELHTKAADCIESGRPLKDCHGEAMKECPMAESGRCPFMDHAGMKMYRKQGMRGMHKGMHEGMMEQESRTPERTR